MQVLYLYKGHVDLVNVRSLLPVHLDVHEVFVHHLRHLLAVIKIIFIIDCRGR